MAFSDSAEELKYLQRCMSDLVSVLALPAVWSGQEPRKIVTTFHDALMATLNLDFLYTRVRIEANGEPSEVLRTAPHYTTTKNADKIRQALNERFGDDPRKWPAEVRSRLGARENSLLPMRLGLEGEIGIVVAGSERADFPTQSERLLLGVAANQVTVGLQQALLLNEQKQVASELDRRVADRTRELAETNEELQLQVGQLRHIPVAAWTLKPDGTPDFVNQAWLEYSGQTLDFVRSHPEAWLTAVHPDDREVASIGFWGGVRTGQGFEMETRFRRERDGVYRWHLNRAVALRDAEGRVLRFVGTSTDIDDRKLAEEALRASEGKLRRVIDTIPTLSWCNLPDGPNEFLSKSWHQYTGLSPEEAHGWGWQAAFHPEDLPPLIEKWQLLLVSGESGELEARLRRHDGEYRWFLIRVAPFRDETGTILRWYGTSTDIHDRKRVEDELKRSEARYRVVVETASDAVVSIDESGAIILANPATQRIFGHNPEELIGKPMTVLMPGAVRKLHETGFKRYLETGARHLNWQGTEVTALRASGEEFPVEVSFGEMIADQRKVFTGLIRDISEKKRAEEALVASERSLSQIINTMPVLAWSALPDGTAEFFNKRWLDYTGLSPEQAQGWGWAEAVHHYDLGRMTKYWQSLITTGGSGEIEARLRRFDGNYRWFLFRADPMRDNSGAILKWYGTNTDIDDRKRAEEALRMRELNLLQITETIPEMLWSASPDGAIDYCNGRLLDYAGISPERVMRDGWMNLLHPDDVEPTAEVWKSCVKSGAPYRVEVRTFHAADNTYRWCMASALPLLDQGRIIRWHGTVVDMHDWKQAQEELRNTQAELARVTRVMTIGQLTASIAHEVNQPLSGIVTNASTCLRMLDSDPPNIDGARETARRTIRDSNRASEVMTRLRTLFSKKQIHVEPLDLNEAAREVITLLSGELQRNNVILKREFSDHLPTVHGDRVQLQQVILNFIHNGADAMDTVNDRPRQLLIRTETDGNHVTVSVLDQGVGFSPEISERLFEPFFTTKQKGMGIGLSVSRSIVEAHHGRLWAARNDGPGSTFAFSIPRESSQ